MRKNGKTLTLGLTIFLILTSGGSASAQTGIDSDTAANFNLQAVAELFKDSDNLEAFEKALNDSDIGVNNLDLNGDGEVDVISVVEQMADETHLLALRVPVAENEFQDVATIAVEKNAAGYDSEIQGNADIYGENYYVVPASSSPSGWKIFSWLFRPSYRPYQTAFSYRTQPRGWKPRRAVALDVYRGVTGRLIGGKTFVTTNARRVKSVTKINYTPRASNRIVVRKKTVIKKSGGAANANDSNERTKIKKEKVVKIKKRGS